MSVPAGDDVFFTDTVDHHAVLGRCAAAVHHGGAGTTALALRHGIPSVICWFGADQPFWGAQLRRAGAGVTMPVTRLTADSLENALRTPSIPTWCGAERSQRGPRDGGRRRGTRRGGHGRGDRGR